MPLTYVSGELVMQGDRIRYAGEPGRVEFIAQADNPDTAWYLDQFGGGCMIVAEKFGSLFLSSTADAEDLEFIGRIRD